MLLQFSEDPQKTRGGTMPTIKEVWENNIHSIEPEKRCEIAADLKAAGYTDKNVETYTSKELNLGSWNENVDKRMHMVNSDDAYNINSMRNEKVDEVAVDALKTFDKVHNLDGFWDDKLDDPIAARYKK